jgi:D-galactarolactone isomerase
MKLSKLEMPEHSCDTHIHIYDPSYPQASNAKMPAPTASVQDYKYLQDKLGTQRVVVVQPSVYGFDNSCTLDSIAAFNRDHDVARGVAAIHDDISQQELMSLRDKGIRGIRFFMLNGGMLKWAQLDKQAKIAADMGWPVHLVVDPKELPQREKQIKNWPCRLVLAHLGMFQQPVSESGPEYCSFCRILEDENVWLKISGAYMLSLSGPPDYKDVGDFAKRIIKQFPQRLLWATDWPHPLAAANPPDDLLLLRLFYKWAGNSKLITEILVDNPKELYWL